MPGSEFEGGGVAGCDNDDDDDDDDGDDDDDTRTRFVYHLERGRALWRRVRPVRASECKMLGGHRIKSKSVYRENACHKIRIKRATKYICMGPRGVSRDPRNASPSGIIVPAFASVIASGLRGASPAWTGTILLAIWVSEGLQTATSRPSFVILSITNGRNALHD